MKKVVIPLIIVMILVGCGALLQPVKLISTTQYHYHVYVGKTVKLTGIGEVPGGVRCYVNDEEYVWLADGTYKTAKTDEKYLYIQYQLKGAPILYR